MTFWKHVFQPENSLKIQDNKKNRTNILDLSKKNPVEHRTLKTSIEQGFLKQ